MQDWEKMFEDSKKDEIDIYSPSRKDKKLKKQFKKLKHKALYLSEEYKEISEDFDEARHLFISCMFQYCGENKIASPLSEKPPSKNEEQSLPKKTSEETKELYREIVKETHPDKTSNLNDKEVKNRNKLYQAAVEGKKKGDFWGILQAALELEVSFENISEQFINDIIQSISKIEKEIEKIKSDIMYKWYNSEPAIKKSIFEQLTKNQPKLED